MEVSLEKEGSNIEDLSTKQDKKLSYEELENVAKQLNEQCKKFYNELYIIKEQNFFKRLDYLFKVIENKDSFTNEYIDQTTTEITNLLTLPGEESTENEGN